MQIWTVDAFATKPYTGNPAAVMIVKAFPSDAMCLKIAAEMNLSETAFVKPVAENHFHIRWFTPGAEVKLCGHATLASSHILFQEKIPTSNRIQLDSLSGPLFVEKNSDEITLDFPLQKIGENKHKATLQSLLNLPIIEAVQAYDDLLIETDANSVRNFLPNAEKIQALACRGLIITSRGNKPYDFISRFFAPDLGVLEDPVTGSAHCKLADYWQKKLNKTHFLAYQASARGGEIQLLIQNDRVLLTGKAMTILKGEWLGPI